MRTMRGDRRWLAAGTAITALMIVLALGAWMRGSDGPNGTGPGGSGEPGAASVPAPVVYYEILDAAGSTLMERRLDGRSLARPVATRPDIEDGRAWTVDPTGTIAIAAIPERDGQRLEAVEIATGAALWSVSTPVAPVDLGVWAADGRRLALATIGDEDGRREAVVVDTSQGAAVRIAIPEDAVLQGIDPDGALILRQHRPSRNDDNAGWQFLRVDPGSRQVQGLTTLPNVGPASDWSEDVDPAVGLGVDSALSEDGRATTVRLWNLASGARRNLATLPSLERLAIDPGGRGVAMSVGQAIRFAAFGGGTTDLYAGDDPISDFAWSSGGGYLAISIEPDGPALTIVERATGRSVAMPVPGPVAALFFVRLVGEAPLPASPLPAAEPTPSPTPGPAGADVAGFTGLLTWWIDGSDAQQVAHVARLVPTTDGGMRVAAEMPPLELGPAGDPEDGGPDIRLIPRPGSTDVLVWVRTPERASGWLWDGSASLMPVALPADWPTTVDDVAWRPDGLALAGSVGKELPDGGFVATFVIAEIGGSRTTSIPMVGAYDRLEGWWSATELRVGHGVCTDGCGGAYSWSARLRIRDRHLTELRAADRANGQIDLVYPGSTSIVLSPRNEDPSDDITIAWPTVLGPADALDVLGLGADGRSLLVARREGESTTIYRVDDPIGRAVKGRVTDPAISAIGRLQGRGLVIEVSPDQAWALAFDRVRNAKLVRLSDGRVWPLDRDRALEWASP